MANNDCENRDDSKKSQQMEPLTGRAYWEDKATKETVALCDDVLNLTPLVCTLNYNNKHDIPLMKGDRKIAICKPIKQSLKLGIYQAKNELFESQLFEAGLKQQQDNRYEGWLYVGKKDKGFYYIHLTKSEIDKHADFLTKILKAAYNKMSK
jgi:hypothetical protein